MKTIKTAAEVNQIINKRQFYPQKSYHSPILELKDDLERNASNLDLQLDPDFQRGRV